MTCFSLTFNFFDVSLITQVLFFFALALSAHTDCLYCFVKELHVFAVTTGAYITAFFFFFAIPFLIFFPFFRSFAHFTHCFVWSPSNLTLVLFTFYAILSFPTLFSRPFGRPLIPFSSLLTVQFLAFCPKLFANLSSIAVFLFNSLFIESSWCSPVNWSLFQMRSQSGPKLLSKFDDEMIEAATTKELLQWNSYRYFGEWREKERRNHKKKKNEIDQYSRMDCKIQGTCRQVSGSTRNV